MHAVLFDFDGVIVDSTPIHLKGWVEAVRTLFQVEIDHETLNSIVGRSTAAIGSLLATQRGFPTAKAELIKLKVAYVLAHLNEIPLIKGAAHFLEVLRQQSIPFGIVSNAPRDFIAAALGRHGLDVPFFLGLEDYQRPKPDAEPYMKGAARLAWRFSDHKKIWVLEDSTHGIDAAVAAHMTPIGICSQHPASVLLAAGAERCFEDLEAALDLLEA